ncbi:MAG: hypothetical protein DRR11_06665 [Gammaproteobacteria bacterium]|nr:MAG: hypothetical protein DRR11_06665 [Gammaproteobacteria bacterium]RLA37128.1 MAG: hypothetical protein DRR15_02975 [Gammaproteobacteria bacterium]
MILSVFVVSWLSVSLQPCLMAMESEVATTMASDHAAHAMHDSVLTSPDADADCDHCPPAACDAVMSCDVKMSVECQADVQCSLDNRRDKLLLNDGQFDIPVSINSAIADDQLIDYKITSPRIRIVATAPGYQPPLNLLNCVYLI